MKKYLPLLLLLLPISSFAYHVQCYSSGKLFYDHQVKKVYPGEGFIIIQHPKSDEVIFADCIIRYRTKHK